MNRKSFEANTVPYPFKDTMYHNHQSDNIMNIYMLIFIYAVDFSTKLNVVLKYNGGIYIQASLLKYLLL